MIMKTVSSKKNSSQREVISWLVANHRRGDKCKCCTNIASIPSAYTYSNLKTISISERAFTVYRDISATHGITQQEDQHPIALLVGNGNYMRRIYNNNF